MKPYLQSKWPPSLDNNGTAVRSDHRAHVQGLVQPPDGGGEDGGGEPAVVERLGLAKGFTHGPPLEHKTAINDMLNNETLRVHVKQTMEFMSDTEHNEPI